MSATNNNNQQIKFILEVEYECGSATMLTSEPDLFKALEQFKDKMFGLFGKDKSTIVPQITGARLKRVNFEA